MSIQNRWSLAQAKAWLRTQFDDGTACPCCNQFVKLSKRELGSNQVATLCIFSRAYKTTPRAEYVHSATFFSGLDLPRGLEAALRAGEFADLKHWNLIESMEGRRADGTKRFGYHRITYLGWKFLENAAAVDGCVQVYNQEVVRRADFKPKKVLLRNVLSDRYDHQELMGLQD